MRAFLSRLSKAKKAGATAVLLSFVLAAGVGAGYLANHPVTADGKFEEFTEELFRSEVSGSSLSLHYSLADPEEMGIQRQQRATLGTMETDWEKTQEQCEAYEEMLSAMDYASLSTKNKLTYDSLLLYFHTRASLGANAILEEPLGPSLGIQAQLPVLLAEYAFYEEQDITDYLNLLSSVGPYFESILAFEEEKSAAGYFMSDETLDRILEQCGAFIEDPESNYMLEVFAEKLESFGGLSKEEQETLNEAHKKILTEQVIPAYEALMEGLEKLRGTGKNENGLAYYEGGRAYYQYLLRTQAGDYDSVETIGERLTAQLEADSREILALLEADPELAEKVSASGGMDLPDMEPGEILEILKERMTADFPEMGEVSWEVRYVHKSMEDYLSPAFYLTPPLDTGSPNVIYINQASQSSNLELFTTLAHEGFPGHLYQTVSFERQEPDPVRVLFDTGGYVEGWATYVESYAYEYAAQYLEADADGNGDGSSDGSGTVTGEDKTAADAAGTAQSVTRLAWLNRSVNLCVYSLLDLGIHYYGWTSARTAQFLKLFGITDGTAVREIFQYIVETPGNYLKYYLGYLNFADLRDAQQEALGDDFDLKEFHAKVLAIGPVQFPVLEKYLGEEL